jgi:hypothetical protein
VRPWVIVVFIKFNSICRVVKSLYRLRARLKVGFRNVFTTNLKK